MRKSLPFLVLFAALSALPSASVTGDEWPTLPKANSNDRLEGPIQAEAMTVVDGDTIEVGARIWLGQVVVTKVRILGIDTPEMKGKCEAEKVKAREAKHFVEHWLASRHRIELRDIGSDKYGGRVTARITSGPDEDLGEDLLKAGLARRYGGKTKSPWCGSEG